MPHVTSLGYASAFLDPVTRCLPLGNGYRFYIPHLMRFAAPDSMSPFMRGGLNPYVYCADDPINRVDPSGHFPLTGDEEIVEAALQNEVRAASTDSIAAQEAAHASTQDGPEPSASRSPSRSRATHPSTTSAGSPVSTEPTSSRAPIHTPNALAPTVPIAGTSAGLEGIAGSAGALKADEQIAANARSQLIEAESDFDDIAYDVATIRSRWVRGEQPQNLQPAVQVASGRTLRARANLIRFGAALQAVGSNEEKLRFEALRLSLQRYSEDLAQARALILNPMLQPEDIMAPPN